MGDIDTLAARINRLSSLLAHGGELLSASDVSMLRRMDPHAISAPGFYKLAGTVLADDLWGPPDSVEDAETRWAAIIVGLAQLGDLHRPGARLGAALVAAKYSEVRFVRLLRADQNKLIDELPALGRFLAAKMTPADFTDAARLLLSIGRTDEERTRRSLARGFYGALFHQDSASN